MNQKKSMYQLAVQASKGDKDALYALFDRYKERMVYIFYCYKVPQEDMEDLLQDIFLHVLSSIDNLKYPDSFRAWFFTIVYRQMQRYISKDDAPNTMEDIAGWEDVAESKQDFVPGPLLESEETRQFLLDIIGRLPDEQKYAVLLYYYQQLSIKEISQAMDCPEGTVKSRLNYARSFIKAEIQKQIDQGNTVYNVIPLSVLPELFNIHAGEIFAQSGLRLPSPENLLSLLEQGKSNLLKKNLPSGKAKGSFMTAASLKIAVPALVLVLAVAAVVYQQSSGAPDHTAPESENGGNTLELEAEMDNIGVASEDESGPEDYAPYYYQFIQDFIIGNPYFLDAEMADMEMNGHYYLFLLFGDGNSYHLKRFTKEDVQEIYADGNWDGSLSFETPIVRAMLVEDGAVPLILQEHIAEDENATTHVIQTRDFVSGNYGNMMYIRYRDNGEELGEIGCDPYEVDGNTYYYQQYSIPEFYEIYEGILSQAISTFGVRGPGYEVEATYGERLKNYFK